MTSYLKRSVALAVALALAGCGTVNERDDIRGASADGNKKVQDSLTQLRLEDQIRGAAVREFGGVWLGGKTVKVSRDAELPPVFSHPIRFAFPDKPTLTVMPTESARSPACRYGSAPMPWCRSMCSRRSAWGRLVEALPCLWRLWT